MEVVNKTEVVKIVCKSIIVPHPVARKPFKNRKNPLSRNPSKSLSRIPLFWTLSFVSDTLSKLNGPEKLIWTWKRVASTKSCCLEVLFSSLFKFSKVLDKTGIPVPGWNQYRIWKTNGLNWKKFTWIMIFLFTQPTLFILARLVSNCKSTFAKSEKKFAQTEQTQLDPWTNLYNDRRLTTLG